MAPSAAPPIERMSPLIDDVLPSNLDGRNWPRPEAYGRLRRVPSGNGTSVTGHWLLLEREEDVARSAVVHPVKTEPDGPDPAARDPDPHPVGRPVLLRSGRRRRRVV